MRINEFFNEDFKVFSNLDNVRSIPSLIDGLKDSQRKAVYAMMVHGNSEIKVAQFGAQASLLTHYAHGEASMCDTIVNLAQNYPGSNNINLFEPVGQFGTILSSESSSPRYIFTKPSKYLREYFLKDDECILEHRYEDNDKVEPKYFLPILPMWIVNGSVGIGTGHSVKILSRDPNKVKTVIKAYLSHKTYAKKTLDDLLLPSFNGWKGQVFEIEPGKFELHGSIEVVNSTTLRVTELPVGYGIDKFKAILADLIDEGKVKDYDNNSTEEGFDFEIKVPREVSRLGLDDLKKTFKLISRQSENITLWDSEGVLNQYETIQEALTEFVDFRLQKYEERRLVHIDILESEMEFLRQKKLFILEWNALDNAGKMKISDLKDHMKRKGVDEANHERLFSLRVTSLTYDLITELEKEIDDKKTRVNALKATTATQMYLSEL